MPPPLSSLLPLWAPKRRQAHRNVAVVSHAEYVPTLNVAAALRVKAALRKRPGDLDLLTLKVVFESRVTWATPVPILVFLSLSVLELRPMYATDRQTSDKSIA